MSATIETFVRTDDTMTLKETADFYDIEPDEVPDDRIQVCAGEWRREDIDGVPHWRFWRDPTW